MFLYLGTLIIKTIKVMEITIEIGDRVQKAFLENLRLENVNEELLKAVIDSYIDHCVYRDDIDMQACMFLDSIESSGELEDIIYENTLK